MLRVISSQKKYVLCILSITDFTMVVKYFIVLSTCIERLIALTFPFRYQNLLIINYINAILICQWIICLIWSIIRDVVFLDEICIEEVFGPLNIVSQGPGTMTFMLCSSVSVITAIALVKVFIELCKMRSRSVTNDQEREVIAATNYVVVTTVLFLICLVSLATIAPLVEDLTGHSTFIIAAYVILAAHSSYGLMNTLVYAVISKSYRVTFRNIFCENHFMMNRVSDLSNS